LEAPLLKTSAAAVAVELTWEYYVVVQFAYWDDCKPDYRGIKIKIADERPWNVYRNLAEVILQPPCIAGWSRPSAFVTAKSESPSPPSRAQTRSGASFGLPKDLSLLFEQCLHFNLQRVGPIQLNVMAGAQSVFRLIAHLSLHPQRHNGSDNRLTCFHVMPSIDGMIYPVLGKMISKSRNSAPSPGIRAWMWFAATTTTAPIMAGKFRRRLAQS
jgi:hypothetical protein